MSRSHRLLLRTPRTLSTTTITRRPWGASSSCSSSSSSSSSPTPLPNHNNFRNNDSHNHHHTNDDGNGGGFLLVPDRTSLVAYSAHLEDVALGTVIDNTVRMEDYINALEAWKDWAASSSVGQTKKSAFSLSSSSSSPSLVPPVGIEAARFARSLLLAMEHPTLNLDTSDNDNNDDRTALLRPTRMCYELVLKAYSACGGNEIAALEAQELLEHMLEQTKRASQHQQAQHAAKPSVQWDMIYPEPNVMSYNTVLNCWCKAKGQHSVVRAEEVLAHMEEWRNHCQVARQNDPSFPYRGCYPTTVTITALIHIWTMNQGMKAHEQVWQLLQEVAEARRNPSVPQHHRFHDVRLGPTFFEPILVSWVRHCRGRYGAAIAEDILSLALNLHDEGLMTEFPTQRMYALVLDAWAKCENSTGDYAQRAHDILFQTIHLYRQGAPIQLDVVMFGTCIAAWSRCANVNDAPEKAEAILKELLSLYEETGLVNLKPDFVLWNTMLMVWLKATERTESADRCANIIELMQKHGCKPKINSYGKVLHAAGHRGLGQQALKLLVQYAHDSNLRLLRDVRALNSVLEALAREARDDSMDRALAFFEKMKVEDSYAKPNCFSYSILLDKLSSFEGRGHAERGRDLLEEMMQRFHQGHKDCRPDTYCVSAAIKVCGGTTGTEDDRRRALDIALETFRKYESYCGLPPNRYVYNAMLRAITCLTASEGQRSERLELLEKVFLECQAAGHVSEITVTIMLEGGASHCLSRLTTSSCREVPYHRRPDMLRLASEKELRPHGS